MRIQITRVAATAAFAVFAIACTTTTTTSNQQPAKSNTETSTPAALPAGSPAPETAAVRPGKDLYTINCLTCHKADGSGGKVTVEGKTLNPDNLTSAKMKAKTDEKLYSYIADGIVDEGMPAFKDTLKPEEIRAVVAHVRDLQK